MSGPGRYYSPRLLLYLISELPIDSRYVAARRPGDKSEWRLWSSKSFQSQLLAGAFNWTQLHAIAAINWDEGNRPEFTPVTDPGTTQQESKPPEQMTVAEIFQRVSANMRG
ncbi:hypothetical protein GCM10009700_35270 [Brevibacterium sanguinis]